MSGGLRAVAIVSVVALAACTRHLVFVEEDHIGLRAKFEGDSPTPAEVHLGYRRGIVTFIPQQSSSGTDVGSVTTSTDPTTGKKTVVIKRDPRDLMSLYTIFKANVGFMDPVELHHFLATGAAAASLLANDGELRKLTKNLKDFDAGDDATPADSGGEKKDKAPGGGGQ